MNENRFEVDTPIGKLVAESSGVEDYPSIYVYLLRPDGVAIDLSCTEIDKDSGEGKVFIWGDTTTDSYTNEFKFTKEQLLIEE